MLGMPESKSRSGLEKAGVKITIENKSVFFRVWARNYNSVNSSEYSTVFSESSLRNLRLLFICGSLRFFAGVCGVLLCGALSFGCSVFQFANCQLSPKGANSESIQNSE